MLLVLDKNSLTRWFSKRLKSLRVHRDTRAYMANVFANYKASDFDDLSIVMALNEANETNQFEAYQRVGDWVLWCGTFCPERMNAFRQIYESHGRLSYAMCYRILRGQWPLYEELADELPIIVNNARKMF